MVVEQNIGGTILLQDYDYSKGGVNIGSLF